MLPDYDDPKTYDYELPEELIARRPLDRRDAARLLVVRPDQGTIEHHRIQDLPDLLAAGDCLVLNDTRVIPARLLGRRTATGGKWEGLYLGHDDADNWRIIGQTRGKLQAGEQITITPAHEERTDQVEGLQLTLIEREENGVWIARAESGGKPLELLEQFGTVPLPPYLQRDLATSDDWERYQTTFAARPGAVAAPTAGLHFSEELLEGCRERGIGSTTVTLHVGVGTFRPVSASRLSEHEMHSEWCELTEKTQQRLADTRAEGGRICCVGTTSVRTLESAAVKAPNQPWSGETDLFIKPPYEFQMVDVLLTNFHLPQSTLFVLVAAFAGLELTHAAYAEAIRERYRFYSYGDAMLII